MKQLLPEVRIRLLQSCYAFSPARRRLPNKCVGERNAANDQDNSLKFCTHDKQNRMEMTVTCQKMQHGKKIRHTTLGPI